MTYNHEYRVFPFPYDRFFESDLMHGIKCRVQTFSDVLVRRIRKFIKDTHDCTISGKPFVQYIFYCYVSGQPSRALNLNSIVEYPDMNVVCDAVIMV